MWPLREECLRAEAVRSAGFFLMVESDLHTDNIVQGLNAPWFRLSHGAPGGCGFL
jgi:hypothetical protein